jgi:hypothetical protein
MPLSTAVPVTASTCCSSVMSFRLTPAASRRATRNCTPARSWPKPCGTHTHARHHGVGDLGGQLNRPHPRTHSHHRPFANRQACCIRRMQHRGTALGAFHQAMRVMHPRIVAAHMPSPNHSPLARLPCCVSAGGRAADHLNTAARPRECDARVFLNAAAVGAATALNQYHADARAIFSGSSHFCAAARRTIFFARWRRGDW